MKMLFLIVAAIAMAASPSVAPSSPSPGSSVLMPQGEPGNGMCCVIGGGQDCLGYYPTGEGCGYNPIYNCSCSSPGSSCWQAVSAPRRNDLCRKIPPPVPDNAYCALVTTYCWTKIDGGTCDDDGGPWSWGGLCTTCGCVGAGGNPLPQGSKQVCDGSSTGC